ncbi:MAG: histidine phosphatase family protein [Pikeienuella sp.]
MSVPIALLRHFPTDWNLERRLQGRADRPLTDDARARLRGLRLPAPWDRALIVASPLSRARETAQILAQGRPVRLDARLVEQDWGAWEGRLSADLLADPGSGFIPTHLMPLEFRPPGGESAQDMLDRLRPAFVEIAQQARPTLVVGHKALMRSVLAEAIGPAALPEGGVEIKRGRLYPIQLAPDGRVSRPGAPMRLMPKR